MSLMLILSLYSTNLPNISYFYLSNTPQNTGFSYYVGFSDLKCCAQKGG